MRKMLIKLAAGAVGGLAATYLIGKAMPLASKKLPERLRPILPKMDPGERLLAHGERILGARFRPKVHRRAVQGMRTAYGVGWPIGLAAFSGLLGLRTAPRSLAAGALLGALVWFIGYEGWLPALGLLPPAHRLPLRKNAAGLASHVVYGTIAALPLAVAARRLES